MYTGNKSVPTGGGGTRVASGEIIVPSTTTVEGLKSIILEAAGCAGKDPKQCRLRRTNGFGEGLGRPCESEQVTLVKEGLTNGSLVWVEDGIVLKKVCARSVSV